ncbi:hypothetical protein [Mycobacterium canetti]|uniref:hypothetical protein n=1 Tax=Mycobacterium canetti TaxID=78331 RepID=UPI0002A583C4|nr:hypothetical protein [Mycobacterium canetti]CCK61911.1 Conserved protein of unknown function [Mycobacterium canettii CIPT 140070010]
MTTLKELGARVAALEANQADDRAVLAAVNALGANQREIATTVREHTGRLDRVETKVDQLAAKSDDTNARVRSLEEGQAEIKDLLVRALDK